MGIFPSLEASPAIRGFDVVQYREWDRGYYYRVMVALADGSSLHAREFFNADERHYSLHAREFFNADERHYSFHWQTADGAMIRRWDDAPHYPHLETHPHHVQEGNSVRGSLPMSLKEVLAEIEKQLGLA